MKKNIIIIVGFIFMAIAGKFYIDYKIDNAISNSPEKIVKSIQDWQNNQSNDYVQQALKQLFANSDKHPSYGNKNSAIKFYEFMDYQCGVCKKFKKTVDDNIDNMTVYYIDFPILGENSVLASKSALAAKMQGKYKQMHDSLMTHRGRLNQKIIFDIAKNIGLDIAKLKLDMESNAVNKQLQYNYQIARRLGAKGTPFNIITNGKGNQIIPGFIDSNQLKSIIKLMQK